MGELACRIMPSGDGHWYWEVVLGGNEVVWRGVSDTEDGAGEDAAAARAAITGQVLHLRANALAASSLPAP
jgi:hypothetical protein